MQGRSRTWLVGMLALAAPIWAEEPVACLVELVRLDEATKASFREELGAIAPEWKLGECQERAVRIQVRWQGGVKFSEALGITATAGGRVLPLIEIYVGRIARHIGAPGTAAALGKALARVTAHELTHYRLQKLSHDREGVMRAGFGFRHLLENDGFWEISRRAN